MPERFPPYPSLPVSPLAGARRVSPKRSFSKRHPYLTSFVAVAVLFTAAEAVGAASASESVPVAPSSPTVVAALDYDNCGAARAAGVTPLHAGQPGYASHLDHNNDGVACD